MRSGLDSVPGRWADDAVARVVELVREDSLQATGRYTDVKNAIGTAVNFYSITKFAVAAEGWRSNEFLDKNTAIRRDNSL